MAITTESTSFTKDVQGRYLCNDISELAGRPFDFIVVGGGTFGAAIAEHLWFRQKQGGGGLRTLVLEGGTPCNSNIDSGYRHAAEDNCPSNLSASDGTWANEVQAADRR